MKTVTAAVLDLTYEVRRLRNDEAHEREKIALGVENALQRFERRFLTSGEPTPGAKPSDS